MKQVLVKKGQILIEDVPPPLVDKGSVLVEVKYSLISAGTETAKLLPLDDHFCKRQGFSVPIMEWFFERLGDFAKRKLLDFSQRTDFLDKQYIEEMLETKNSVKLWYILNFALWHARWIENIYHP